MYRSRRGQKSVLVTCVPALNLEGQPTSSEIRMGSEKFRKVIYVAVAYRSVAAAGVRRGE